jgi:hypothetical protein
MTCVFYSTVTPIIATAIMFASNGHFHIRFIDTLFICVSAATGTGLATVELSSLTAWQQAILVILELVGSPVRPTFLLAILVTNAVLFSRRQSHGSLFMSGSGTS